MSRRINAPGIEINEIDRSSYVSDNSIVGTMSLIAGFADNGDDYNVKWINSMSTFKNVYGEPTNDAETYFYNAAYEVLNNGGVLTTAKLPYSNEAFEHFSYTSYQVLSNYTEIQSSIDILNNQISSQGLDKSMYQFLLLPNIDVDIMNYIQHDMVPNHAGDYVVRYEADQTILANAELLNNEQNNVTRLLNKFNIYLTSINDMFDFLNNRLNFTYEQRQCFDQVFYKDSHVRNEACYLLSAIWKFDDQSSKNYISSVIGFDSYEQTQGQFPSLKETIATNLNNYRLNDFSDVVLTFAETKTLNEFKNYYVNLKNATDALSTNLSSVELSSDAKALQVIVDSFDNEDNWEKFNTKYTDLNHTDKTLTSYVEIKSNPLGKGNSGLLSYDDFDNFKTGNQKPKKNQIIIADITRSKYSKDTLKKEYVGIFPMITTAANALYYQGLIKDDNNISDYNTVKHVQTTYTKPETTILSGLDAENNQGTIGLNEYLGGESAVTFDTTTVSKDAVSRFPQLRFINDRLERKYLKQIGVVVFKMYNDYANEGKISFLPVETFVGSLNRFEKDELTNADIFIDNIVNDNSNYINLFSNIDLTNGKDSEKTKIDRASLYLINNQDVTSLGFYEKDTSKRIHVTNSILNALDKIFAQIQDYTKLDVDILCDAGVSNIAQFIASTQLKDKDGKFVENQAQRNGFFDLNSNESSMFKLNSAEDTRIWRLVINKFDDFVKNTRKDCVFLADSPRPFCLEGNEKLIRKTKPGNTIKNTILPKLKYISGVINSSYSVGYLNWFKCFNAYNNYQIWIPPSIKAMGIYIQTDTYSNFWSAPAGLNRGVINDAIDVAFNPNLDESGDIYVNSWNYAINYPIGGIVIEGQRTFQSQKTALDRVNVRRLMLGLEKATRNYVKYYNYEGNNSWLRQRLVDGLSNYFETVKSAGGMLDYRIICDDRNNTVQTIENNELHVAIYVKPVKSIEFIILNFICTSQSANVDEMVASDFG